MTSGASPILDDSSRGWAWTSVNTLPGENLHRFGITRQGNRYLRTALHRSESAGVPDADLSRDIKARRAGTPMEYIAIADRCLKRLHKKYYRLLNAGKHANKVKVACAREMVGFVWESLRWPLQREHDYRSISVNSVIVYLVMLKGEG
jgi:hypothetical protein